MRHFWSGLAWGLFWLIATGCRSNTCQGLCDAYYDIALSCELFSLYDGIGPTSCLRSEDDPQTLRQQADYAVRQCRQDFLRTEESSRTSRDCCRSACFETLGQQFEAISGSDESSIEQKRDICLQFQALLQTGDAPWCQRLASRQACEQSWDETYYGTSTPQTPTLAPSSILEWRSQ